MKLILLLAHERTTNKQYIATQPETKHIKLELFQVEIRRDLKQLCKQKAPLMARIKAHKKIIDQIFKLHLT